MVVKSKNIVQLKKDCSQEQVRYEIEGKVFLVLPVFQDYGTETVSSTLLRLMEDDFVGVI